MAEYYQVFRIKYELGTCQGTALVGGIDAQDARYVLKEQLCEERGFELNALGFQVLSSEPTEKIRIPSRVVSLNSLDDF